MESWPQNPELRNNPENFHPCIKYKHFTQWAEIKSKKKRTNSEAINCFR